MKLKAFSVYDIKAEMFSPPFFMGTIGEATRAFRDLVNDSNTTPGKYPGDFRLTCIGEFDNVTGYLTTDSIDSLGFGTDYQNLPSSAIPLSLAKG